MLHVNQIDLLALISATPKLSSTKIEASIKSIAVKDKYEKENVRR